MLGPKESTVATGAASVDKNFLEELDDLTKRVQELDERLEAHGRELDRLEVDVGFWNTVLLEFLPKDEEIN